MNRREWVSQLSVFSVDGEGWPSAQRPLSSKIQFAAFRDVDRNANTFYGLVPLCEAL
jgi:hypothetical protein